MPTIENWVASDSGGSATTTITMTAPSGITSGELLVIFAGSDADNETGAVFSINTGTYPGWTKINEYGDGDSDAHVAAWYKISSGSEGDVVVDSTVADELIGWYLRISSVKTATPITDEDGFASIDSVTIYDAATGTLAPSADDLLLAAVIHDGGDCVPASDNSKGSFWTGQLDDHTSGTSGNDVGGILAYGLATSTSEPGTYTVTPAASDGSAGIILAIKEATTTTDAYANGSSTGLFYTGRTVGSVGTSNGSSSSPSGVGGGPPPNNVNTYYFDASTAGPTDSTSAWTNDANAFDGSLSTFARTTTELTSTMTATGTTAPSSGTDGIISVRGRIYLECDDSTSWLDYTISDKFGTITIAKGSVQVLTAGWTSWFDIAEPETGWTWTNLSTLDLSVLLWAGSGVDLYRVEIEVTSNPALTAAYYYVNANDSGPTDPNSNWTNEANAVDGDWATVASAASAGSESLNNLSAYGTNAPASGDNIIRVYGRISGAVSSGLISAEFGQFLTANWPDITVSHDSDASVSQFVELFSNIGWTWALLQSLGFNAFTTSTSGDFRIAQIKVLTSTTFDADTYYCDASISGPTDPGSAWLNPENAFDGSNLTSASTTATSSALSATGTTASGGTTSINRVMAFVYGSSSTVDEDLTTTIANGAETLATVVNIGADDLGWRWSTAVEPAAGWDWSIIGSLTASTQVETGA